MCGVRLSLGCFVLSDVGVFIFSRFEIASSALAGERLHPFHLVPAASTVSHVLKEWMSLRNTGTAWAFAVAYFVAVHTAVHFMSRAVHLFMMSYLCYDGIPSYLMLECNGAR